MAVDAGGTRPVARSSAAAGWSPYAEGRRGRAARGTRAAGRIGWTRSSACIWVVHHAQHHRVLRVVGRVQACTGSALSGGGENPMQDTALATEKTPSSATEAQEVVNPDVVEETSAYEFMLVQSDVY